MYQILNKIPTAQVLQLFKRYWSQILVFIVTITGCWYLWSPSQSKPETYKPEVKQNDGSIIMERKPDPEAHAAMLLPKGAKLQRKITVTVQAKNPIQSVSGSVVIEETKQMMKSADVPSVQTVSDTVTPDVAVSAFECPPVTLDLALVRMPDESQRVIASSQDGNILGAVDIPVESAKPTTEPFKWSAGIVGDPYRQTGGVFVDRRYGWLQIGAELMQRDAGRIPSQINLRIGVSF